MTVGLKDAAIAACWHALIPIARICIGFGIGYREFQTLSKSAFVAAAKKELLPSGKKITTSRISARTGMSRKDIQRVSSTQGPEFSVPGGCLPLTDILTEWASSKYYMARNGEPVEMPFSGPRRSITTLVRENAPGLSPKAALDELIEFGCVEPVGELYRLRSRHFVPVNINPSVIEQGGRAMFALGTTIADNLSANFSADRQFEQMAVSTKLRDGSVPRFLSYVRANAETFLEIADDWMNANESIEEETADKRITGVGVYSFDVETYGYVGRTLKYADNS